MILTLMPDQPDLPFGATYQCRVCGTRVRPGQPHTAESPRPHQTYQALTRVEIPAILGESAGLGRIKNGVSQ